MKKLLGVALILASFLRPSPAQSPTNLETFTNPDGAFHFLYPANYELLVGDRILRATQGRSPGIPVCDFSIALVCVIYPIEELDSARLEAAGFSVETVPGATAEGDCLPYSNLSGAGQPEPSSLKINGRVFHEVSTTRLIAGHAQSVHLYRTFQGERCYELRIAVSASDEPLPQARPTAKTAEEAKAEKVRESLRLILGSFAFRD